MKYLLTLMSLITISACSSDKLTSPITFMCDIVSKTSIADSEKTLNKKLYLTFDPSNKSVYLFSVRKGFLSKNPYSQNGTILSYSSNKNKYEFSASVDSKLNTYKSTTSAELFGQKMKINESGQCIIEDDLLMPE